MSLESETGTHTDARFKHSAKTPTELLGARAHSCRLTRRNGGLLFAVGLLLRLRLSALADIDAALEERAIFNRDARRDNVAGQGAVAADIDAIARGQIAAHRAGRSVTGVCSFVALPKKGKKLTTSPVIALRANFIQFG